MDKGSTERSSTWINKGSKSDSNICYFRPKIDSNDQFWFDIHQLVQTLQIHKYSKRYCQKPNSKGSTECIFGFPKPLIHESGFIKTTNEDQEVILLPRRLNPLVNTYNPIILSIWRGNMDISFVTSPFAVDNYLCKYQTRG